jgi:hypothetical protein
VLNTHAGHAGALTDVQTAALKVRFLIAYQHLVSLPCITDYWFSRTRSNESAQSWFKVFCSGLADGLAQILIATDPPTVQDLVRLGWKRTNTFGVYCKTLSAIDDDAHDHLYIGSGTGMTKVVGLEGRKKSHLSNLKNGTQ